MKYGVYGNFSGIYNYQKCQFWKKWNSRVGLLSATVVSTDSMTNSSMLFNKLLMYAHCLREVSSYWKSFYSWTQTQRCRLSSLSVWQWFDWQRVCHWTRHLIANICEGSCRFKHCMWTYFTSRISVIIIIITTTIRCSMETALWWSYHSEITIANIDQLIRCVHSLYKAL